MPRYKATLDNGMVVTLEGDHEPSEQDVLDALGSQPVSAPEQRPTETPPPEGQNDGRGIATAVSLPALAGSALNFAGRAGKAAFYDFLNSIRASDPMSAPGALPEGANIQAVVPGQEMPTERTIRELPAALRIPASAPGSLVETVPRMAAGMAAPMAGIPAALGFAGAFGLTEEGFSPKQAAIAAAIPFVGKYSGAIAGRVAQKFGVDSVTARNWVRGISGTATPVAGLAAEGEREISKLPEEQQHEARIEMWSNLAGQAALGPMGVKFERGKGAPYARSQQETAEVHGNVRAQPVEGEGEVSVEEGGRGVQSPAQAPEAEILLIQREISDLENQHAEARAKDKGYIVPMDDRIYLRGLKARLEKLRGLPETPPEPKVEIPQEDLDLIEKERKDLDAPELVHEPSETDENNPFMGGRNQGRVWMLNPSNGKVYVNRLELSRWLQGFDNPETKRMAVRSGLAEEKNHLAVSEEDAAALWNSLTKLEQKLHLRRYTGEWTNVHGLTDAQLGWEASNSMMMRLARMPLQEALSYRGREGFTVRTADALANIIFKLRKAFGTSASREQLAILDRAQRNLDAMRASARGDGPAMQNFRRRGESPEERQLDMFLPPVTQQREAQTTPPESSEFWKKPMSSIERARLEAINKGAWPKDLPSQASTLSPSFNEYRRQKAEEARLAAEAQSEDSAGLFGERGEPAAATPEEAKAGFEAMRKAIDVPGMMGRRETLLRQYSDAVKEIRLAGQRKLGLRRVTAAEKSFKVGWSNGSQRWYASPIGSWERTAVEAPNWNNPESVREWREKHSRVISKKFATKGEEIELDSNEILVGASSVRDAELIAQHLPEPPFAVNAAERNPLLKLRPDAPAEEVLQAMMDWASEEPNNPDIVKETAKFLDKISEGPAMMGRRLPGVDEELSDAFNYALHQVQKDVQEKTYTMRRDMAESSGEAAPSLLRVGKALSLPEYKMQLLDMLEDWSRKPDLEKGMLVSGERMSQDAVDALDALVATLKEKGKDQGGRLYDAILKEAEAAAPEKSFAAMMGRRGKKQPYEPEQQQMFGVVTAKGVPGAPDVPLSDRISATEAGALPRITANEISQKAEEFITKAITPKPVDPSKMKLVKAGQEEFSTPASPEYNRPSFREFTDWAKRNLQGVTDDQLRDLWLGKFTSHLMQASPERLGELRKAYQLERRYGSRPIPPPVDPGLLDTVKKVGPEGVRAERKREAGLLLNEASKMEQMLSVMPTTGRGKFARARLERSIRAMLANAEDIMAGKRLPLEKEPGAPEDPEAAQEEAEMDIREGVKPMPGDIRARVNTIRKKALAGQAYRNRIITELFSRMLADMRPRAEVLAREAVALEDIDFANENARKDPWREISKSESESPAMLEEIFKDEARRSSDDPVSWTKNLMVLLNKRTGNVEMVSAYPHGRSGLMATEPGVASIKLRPNKPIADLLHTYKPIYRILLKEPVQNFHQHFADIEEFNSKLGREGQEMARANQFREFAGEGGKKRVVGPEEEASQAGRVGLEAPVGTRPEDIAEQRGTSGVTEGEGGGVTGPEADITRLSVGIGRGELQRAYRLPVSAMEAFALRRTAFPAMTEEGKLDSPESLRLILDDLAQRRKRNQLNARDWAAITALQKASVRIKRENPDWTPQQVADHTLNTIYEIIRDSETPSDYLAGFMGRFTPPARAAGGAQPPGIPVTEARPSGIVRDITQRRSVAPTTARPGQVPPGQWPNPTTTPPRPFQAQPRPPAATPFLSLKEQAALKLQEPGAGPSFPLEMEYAKPAGGPVEHVRPGFKPAKGAPYQAPAMMNRRMAQTEDALTKTRGMAVAWFKRRATNNQLAAGADQVDNLTNVLANQVQKKIQLHSANPEVLQAALPMRQSGAVQRHYQMSEEAQAAFEELSEKDPNYLTGLKLSRSKDIARSEKGRAMLNTSRGKIIRKLLEEGMIDHTGVTYSIDDNAYRQLKDFEGRLMHGEQAARKLMASADATERRAGRAQLQAVESLRPGLEYAKKNWHDSNLRDVALESARQLDQQYDRETKAGYSVRYDPDYIPGRYEGELFDDNAVRFFGQSTILGRQFRQGKVFDNYYQAAENGPYVPVTTDVSALTGHRVRSGMRNLNRKTVWAPVMKEMIDPDSGEPVAVDPKKGSGGKWVAPDAEHKLVYLLGPQQDPIAIRKGYSDLVERMLTTSELQKSVPTRELLEWEQRLKHVILAIDIFHPMRLTYYGASIMGRKFGYKGGLSVLEYAPGDLDGALKEGRITPQAHRWATEKVNVGGTETTRADIADLFRQETGLNIGRISDAIYQDLVRSVPFVRGMNKFIFDQLQRGLMMQSAVESYIKLANKHPGISQEALLRDVARDINFYFGSIGRQGLFRSQTFQDIVRLPFLAPQWVEGLVQKELRFAGRLAGAPLRAAGLQGATGRQGLPQMGTLGMGMAKGLAAMFALTQVLNLITRRKPTWENEEEGHKMDAWIPSAGEGNGFWLSPLSVFQEITHDAVRLFETKPTVVDALNQIGENKLSPYGRAALILAKTSKLSGQRLTSTGAVAAEMGKQFAPVPITLSALAQSAGHAVLPGTVSATQPGQVQRQMTATLGLKTEPAQTAHARIRTMADRFMEREGLKKQTGWEQVQTDEPSYTKLRGAIRGKDVKGATRQLQELRKHKSDTEIMKAMKLWSRAPFTGNQQAEKLFLASLDDRQMETYSKANEERWQILEGFYDLMANAP